MKEKVKFIWDFYGDEAEEIAKHHALHLKEYIEKNLFNDSISSTERVHSMHCMAYIIAPFDKLAMIRDTLKPHRAHKIVISII